MTKAFEFQSTLPVRGATSTACIASIFDQNFNPRSPCGERHYCPNCGAYMMGISIHAPRAGSDSGVIYAPYLRIEDFNPRSPCGERQRRKGRHRRTKRHFNPRSPCGERQWLYLVAELSV